MATKTQSRSQSQSQSQSDDRFSSQPRRIVLTGFMGSGKSTVGPLVAARLGWRFVDVDDVVVAEAGVAIREVFARGRETIARLVGEDELVLALGGGAIEDEATRELLTNGEGTLLAHLEVTLET